MIRRLWNLAKLWSQLMRVSFQIVYGYFRISKLSKPLITIFGAARASLEDDYAGQAHELSKKFATVGISVVTGGGSGIMEAASCGAVGNGSASIGIGVKDLGEGRNPCVKEYFELDHFFARKWLLTRYSTAFIIFPGGYGTLDELFEVLTLVRTKKLPRVPIILIGVEYWSPFMVWLKREALGHRFIEERHLELFILTDDLHEAFNVIKQACLAQGSCPLE